MRQRKILTNLGKDTHVRDCSENIFQTESHSTYQIITGEIQFTQPEPIFNQNMVTVKPSTDSGRIGNVAYPGAFIDPISGNLHGTYEGPIMGQMVAVGFVNGNRNSPFVVNKYPYQGTGNTLFSAKYKTPLTKASYNADDVMMGHYSGSFLSFNSGFPITANGIPGSVKLKAATDFNLESGNEVILKSILSTDLQSAIVKLTGSTNVQLNGNTNFAVKYTELKSAFDTLKTDFNNLVTAYNSHIHITTATIGAGATPGVISPTATIGTSSTADMSASKNSKVLM